MELNLVKGSFEKEEALDIIAQMIQIKIKFHERKIQSDSNEEDIKMRELRIKQLQQELFHARQLIQNKPNNISIHATIVLD